MESGEKIGDSSEAVNSAAKKWEKIQEEIPFDLEKTNKLVLEEVSDEKFGPGRNDRYAKVVNPEGGEKRTSAIFVGKKEGPETGAYISLEDTKEQLKKAYIEAGEGATIVRLDPPEELSIGDALNEIESKAKEGGDWVEISKNYKITNQDARNFRIHKPLTEENNSQQKIAQGVFWLGNQIEIPNGDYVTEKALQEALANFVFETEQQAAVEEVVYVPPREMPAPVKTNVSNRMKKILPIIGVTVALLLGSAFVTADTTDAIQPQSPTPPAVEQIIPPDDISQENPTPPPDQESITALPSPEDIRAEKEAQLRGVRIGDVYEVPSGVTVHESSDYEFEGANSIGTIGSTELPADSGYTIQGFSVLDPVTHDVIAGNVTWEEGTKLEDHLKKIADETGYSVDDLVPWAKIHIGQDGSSAGWADSSDIIDRSVNAEGERNA